MSSKIPRGFAVAAGTGLAIGLGLVCLGPGKRRPRTTPMTTSSFDSALLLEQLVDRLDRIEVCLSPPEPIPLAHSSSLTELDLRIQQQTKDIETLQIRMSENRPRVDAEATPVKRGFAEVAKEDPAVVQSMLDTTLSLRIEDLRVRLHTEMVESVEATLTRFEQTIDSRVSSRISTIEKTLTDQSGTITALSQRGIESEADLQRLISVAKRLCERTDAPSVVPMPAKEPSFLDLPFERRLNEAMNGNPNPPPIIKETGGCDP